MAIVVGIVSQEDRTLIVRAGYTLADHPAVLPLLKDMEPFGATEEEAVAVWVDCDVTDLSNEECPIFRTRSLGDQAGCA